MCVLVADSAGILANFGLIAAGWFTRFVSYTLAKDNEVLSLQVRGAAEQQVGAAGAQLARALSIPGVYPEEPLCCMTFPLYRHTPSLHDPAPVEHACTVYGSACSISTGSTDSLKLALEAAL
jgi:hypothetical protein